MKKFIILSFVLVLSLHSGFLHAQTFYNNTNCDVTIRVLCYDPTMCPTSPVRCFTNDVLAGNTFNLSSLDVSCCPNPYKILYEVCWINACVSNCAVVNDNTSGHCMPFSTFTSASLTCGQCGTGMPPNLVWVGGNLELN